MKIGTVDAPGRGSRRMAGAAPLSAHDEFSCGATDLDRVRAPGNLTGDCPNARKRAEQRKEPR
jgi:hypothetical protein